MQVEVKMLLGDTGDYHRLTTALAPLFIAEQSYVDWFLDFPTGALTAANSVLRLRVPCATPAGEVGAGHPSERAFLPGLDARGCDHQPYAQAPALAAVARSDGSDCPPMGGGRAPLSRPCGRIVFKQHNTVEKGHQMNFILEDAQVPSEVVDRLTAGRENAFDVLVEYAARQEALAVDGATTPATATTPTAAAMASKASPSSAAGKIVDRLRYTAARLGLEAGGEGLDDSADGGADLNTSQEQEESSRHYGNIRYAAGTATPKRMREAETHAQRRTRCELVAMGNYQSTRRIYRYLQPRQLDNATGTTAGAPAEGVSAQQQQQQEADMEWRSRLVLRVDKTLYPFGEKYELEVPRINSDGCSGLLEDVTEELKRFLESLQIKYQLGSEGKYARFICGMRSLRADPRLIQDVTIRLTNARGYGEVRANLEQLIRGGGGGGSDGGGGVGARPGDEARDGRRRRISNMDLDPSSTGTGSPFDETSVDLTSSTEQQENYFFDGTHGELAAQRCFLRLRRAGQPVRYELVLKEKSTFAAGTQSNRTSMTALSEDVARALLDAPGPWLAAEHEHNAVAHALWTYFGLRTLVPTAFFTTTRITAPWWSAQCQRATVRKRGGTGGWSGSSHHGACAPGAAMDGGRYAFTQPASYTQLEQQLQRSAGGEVIVPPLYIHLDCSQYRIPLTDKGKQRQQRIPFTPFALSQPNAGSVSSGEAVFELYEIEVTNILTVAPSVVLEELTGVLDSMGVEWQTGVHSKLDQYYALANSVNGA